MNKKSPSIIFRVFLFLSSLAFLPHYSTFAMRDKDDFPSDQPYHPSSSKEQKNNTKNPQETSHDLLSTLSNQLHLAVVNFLNYQDHFQLAQTNRKHLFLWGATSRVPEPLDASNLTQKLAQWEDFSTLNPQQKEDKVHQFFKKTYKTPLLITNPRLSPQGLESLMSEIQIANEQPISAGNVTRLIEITENDRDGDYLLAFEDFRLKPWLITSQGLRITYKLWFKSLSIEDYFYITPDIAIGYADSHAKIVPGPARIENVVIFENAETQHAQSLHQIFSSLSQIVPLGQLIPLLKSRSPQKRAFLLAQLMRDHQVEVRQNQITISQPDKERTSLNTNEVAQELLGGTVRVAAFRNSSLLKEIKIADLIKFIRYFGTNETQRLLDELPRFLTSRVRLLSWFHDVLEFFDSGCNSEQDRSQSNDAEVLLGSWLMEEFKEMFTE